MFYQGNFKSEIEWVSFKNLFWNTNESIEELMIYVTSGVSF